MEMVVAPMSTFSLFLGSLHLLTHFIPHPPIGLVLSKLCILLLIICVLSNITSRLVGLLFITLG